nr:ATP-binding cassette domain-containing protein [Pectobacterium colocasium]
MQKPDSGEVRLVDNAWSTLTERERRPLRARIQTITQDPLSSFDPQFTVAQILNQPLRLRRDLSDDEKQRRILTLLEYVGLTPDLLSRRPRALSGGQRQRVSIAQALASEPEILICDEPVSALDVTTQAQVLDLLVALQRQLGLTMLFISHDSGRGTAHEPPHRGHERRGYRRNGAGRADLQSATAPLHAPVAFNGGGVALLTKD